MPITVIYGAMFSGKSKYLVELTNEYKEHLEKFVCFKPIIDKRFNKENEIVSRAGISTPAVLLDLDFSIKDIEKHINQKTEIVILDEIHFFHQQVIENLFNKYKNSKIAFYLAGLDTDFIGKEFEATKYALENADNELRLFSNCSATNCKNQATHNARLAKENQERILVGDKEYAPMCKEHWHEFTFSK